MVKNGNRNVSVKGKTQIYNPVTGHYIKRDSLKEELTYEELVSLYYIMDRVKQGVISSS